MKSSPCYSRRDLLRVTTLAAAAMPVAGLKAWANQPAPPEPPAKPADRWRGLNAGVASYTLRKMPLDQAIKGIQRVGLRYCSIKDSHCPLQSTTQERREVAQKFKDAGITPISCGNITLSNDAANIRQAFEYARDLGLQDIVCSPDPASLPILDKMVKEFDIKIAIHNHGPGDKRFPTPNEAWNAVQPYDKRVGLCIDVGHTARAKIDPAEVIAKYQERLYDLHFKDVSAFEASGATIEGGRGVMPIETILAVLLTIRYAHLLSFEYEKDENDPLPGLAETIGYTKGLLAGL